MNIFKTRYMKLACVSAIVIIADQLTKWIIAKKIVFYGVVEVIPGFFNLVHIHNTGGAFGIFAGRHTTLQSLLFILVAVVAICLVLYLYKNTPSQYPTLSFGFELIFGGAVGNLIDRIRFGRVTDFMDVYIGDLHWPAFNVADSAITVGMIIFAFYVLFRKISI